VQSLQQYAQLASQRENIRALWCRASTLNRTLLSDVLDAVSLVVPENAWFQTIDLQAADPISAKRLVRGYDHPGCRTGGKISIDGETYSFETCPDSSSACNSYRRSATVQLTAANQTQKADGAQLAVKGFSIGAAGREQ